MDRLRGASTATITTQLFRRGLRNTFLYGLKPLDSDRASFVGAAFTLRYIPAREDLDVVESFKDPGHPQRVAVESVEPGDVLIMDCRGDGRAASAGDILATRILVRGAVGLVTDGSVRDGHVIKDLALPVFCSSVSATTNLARHHAVEMQVPIGCAGVPIFPGDILVGDREGVACIPREMAEEVAEDAYIQERLERFLRKRVADGAAVIGTYPPDAATQAAFAAWADAHPDPLAIRDAAR